MGKYLSRVMEMVRYTLAVIDVWRRTNHESAVI